MLFIHKSSVLVACTFLLGVMILVVDNVNGESCMSKFKNGAAYSATMKKCQTKVGLTDKDMEKITPDDLEKSGYEDKCYFKCVLDEMKMFGPDGKFDLAACEADFKENGPADKVDALMAIIKTCMESTPKNPLSKEPCKAAAIMKTCYMKEEAKVC